MGGSSAADITQPLRDSDGRAILILDAQHWKNADDFYNSFFAAVHAPLWHGRNLDALNDSVCNGAINGVDGPYTVIITSYGEIDSNTRAMVDKFVAFFREDLRTPVKVSSDKESAIQRREKEDEVAKRN